MVKHPLAEVFGFPVDNMSQRARRYRQNRLCPFNNRVPNCTKDKANDPLGVCSIFADEGNTAITCPVRFRQDWIIAEDAAAFFFPPGANWTSLTEVRLNDRHGKSAGNVDFVLVSYDDRGQVIDFGSLEVQAVYISGNVRRPFQHYMQDPENNFAMDWTGQRSYPRPDYLSSSRKRLVPQLIYKGGILRSWGKKQAVAIEEDFYKTMPDLQETSPESASLVWFIYNLVLDPDLGQYQLQQVRTLYTDFNRALDRVITPDPGPIGEFVDTLQEKLDKKFEDEQNPPDTFTLSELL